MIAQAAQKFIDDENFLKNRAFAQFLWRRNISNFENKCKLIKVEKSNKLESKIEEEVKANFMEEFSQLTHEEGRKLLKGLGVSILLKWDIANAIIFYSIRKAKDLLKLKLRKRS